MISNPVPPRIAPFEIADKAVNSGDSVSAVCTIVNGDTPLEISWVFNDVPIDKNHREITVLISRRNSVLSIDSVSQKHAGAYTCVASNNAGSTSFTSQLVVNGT